MSNLNVKNGKVLKLKFLYNSSIVNKYERRKPKLMYSFIRSFFLSLQYLSAPNVAYPAVSRRWSGECPVSVSIGAVLSLKGLTEGFSMASLLDPILLSRHNVTICVFTAVQIHSQCSHGTQSAGHFHSLYPGNRKKGTIAKSSNKGLWLKLK